MPYFAYFGANATDAGGKSYYSYDIAGSNWHVVNLDSECQLVPGGCGAGSAQDLWLEADLAANSTENVIAVWHKPRYSSGATNYQDMQALWDDLYAAGVDILLDGHDHIYERTVPMKSGATLAVRRSPTRRTASASSRSGPAARRTTARDAAPDERRPQRRDLRDPEAHAPRHDLRLDVPADRRQHVHRLRHRHGPCRAAAEPQAVDDGRNANDSSGLANHASLIGSPTFVAGQVGQALSLTGSAKTRPCPTPTAST